MEDRETARMRKYGERKRLDLWWQLYRTSFPVWDLENFRPMDFCWHECTFVHFLLEFKFQCTTKLASRSCHYDFRSSRHLNAVATESLFQRHTFISMPIGNDRKNRNLSHLRYDATVLNLTFAPWWGDMYCTFAVSQHRNKASGISHVSPV